MPATRLRPVVELTPLPPAVRALYARSLSPAPPQAQHRTVSHPTRPHAPRTAHRSQFCEKCRRPPAALILQSLHTRPKKHARTRKPSPEDDDLLSDSELVHILQGWVTVSPPNFSRKHKC